MPLPGNELNPVKTPFLEKWERDIEEFMGSHGAPPENPYLQTWGGGECVSSPSG